MENYCYLRNIQDRLSDEKTLYERRFGEPFKGPIIPFGSLVEYYPISAKDQSRIHQFGMKILPGVFLGYAEVRNSDVSGNALQDSSEQHWETYRGFGKSKTKHACIVEADESTSIRLEGSSL